MEDETKLTEQPEAADKVPETKVEPAPEPPKQPAGTHLVDMGAYAVLKERNEKLKSIELVWSQNRAATPADLIKLLRPVIEAP